MTKPTAHVRRLAELVPDARVVMCIDCGWQMEPGYQPGEWRCPECGLAWDLVNNKWLAIDPEDTGKFSFYCNDGGEDVQY